MFETTLRCFAHPAIFKLNGGEKEPAVAADQLYLMLEKAKKTNAACGAFHSSACCTWLDSELRDLTPTDPPPPPTAAPTHVETSSEEEDDSEDSDDQQEQEPSRCPEMRAISWSSLVPAPPCKHARQHAQWRAEAEAIIPKRETDRRLKAGEFEFCPESRRCHPEEIGDGRIKQAQIRGILTGNAKPVSDRVGIGEITDQDHHVRRAATENGYTQPVYLAYAKRKMVAFTVLGEYSGDVVTGSMATRELRVPCCFFTSH